MHYPRKTVLSAWLTLMTVAWSVGAVSAAVQNSPGQQEAPSQASLSDQIKALEEQARRQQAEIDALVAALKQRDSTSPAERQKPAESEAPAAAPVTQEELQKYTVKVDDLKKEADSTKTNLGGFKFSGDFRFRGDAQLRSGNEVAPPLQNIRSRYRLRLNTDKDLNEDFKVHAQLSTGPFVNELTNDTDMAALGVKPPFSVSEAWVDYHPSKVFSIRGGRMEEVWADQMRFLWDDDIRFNGMQQIVKFSNDFGWKGFTSFELRSGEYILSNPNVVILPEGSPFVTAGFQVGQKVRSANLFDPGFLLKQKLGETWSHQFGGNFLFYRNKNQIQLSSTPPGFPVVINPILGLVLSGPITGTGNATTTPNGAIFNAPHFQIARAYWRLMNNGLTLGNREMPLYFDFQGARNTGTGRQRDAVMGTVNLGNVKKAGDLRFLYQFA